MDEIRRDLYPMGRKHCSRCKCWRPVSDFGRAGGRLMGILRAHCLTCDRVKGRVRNGLKARGKPYRPRYPLRDTCARGHEMSEENIYREPNGRRCCRQCRRLRQRRPLEVERRRIMQEAKRREAGKATRPRPPTPQSHREKFLLSSGPFGRWLDENAPREEIEDWAVGHGLDTSQIHKIREGRQEFVHIDTVDRALLYESTLLSDLYPELYDFDDELVAA